MAGLGKDRGSKSSSSKSIKDRIKDARDKGVSGISPKKKGVATGGAKKSYGGASPRKAGQGGKGNYILTESADNLIGGAFTKGGSKGGNVLKTRGELRAKRKELLEKRGGPKSREERNDEARKAYRDTVIERRKKQLEKVKGKIDKTKEDSKGNLRGPKRTPSGLGQTGGNVGPGGKGPNRTGGSKAGIGQGGKRGGPPRQAGGNQIDKVRGPKGSAGPKRSPGQTGGNVGPGGKGPNRIGGSKAGIGQGGKRGGPPRQTGGNVGPGGKGPNRRGVTEYEIF